MSPLPARLYHPKKGPQWHAQTRVEDAASAFRGPDEPLDLSEIATAWCARRAVAFVVISSSYTKSLRNKVHFEPKSAFEGVTL